LKIHDQTTAEFDILLRSFFKAKDACFQWIMAGQQAFKARVSQQKPGSQAKGLRKTTLQTRCHAR
jgi:hypothetical protein